MKHRTAIRCLGIALVLMALLLTAVTTRHGEQPSDGSSTDPDSALSAASSAASVLDKNVKVQTCRVVHRDGENLLLAAQDGTAEQVYLLSLGSLPDEDDSLEWITAGTMVVFGYTGGLGDGFPQQPDEVEWLSAVRGGVDDLCVLYLQVLTDLWEEDDGLNSGVTRISVDLEATSLWASEQAAVAWKFAQDHEVELVHGGYDSLKEQGYLTPDDPTNPNTLYHWSDGCLFTIAELPLEGIYYGLRPLSFEAKKWRSGLGASWFTDCTAVQTGSGYWSDYHVGGYAIS